MVEVHDEEQEMVETEMMMRTGESLVEILVTMKEMVEISWVGHVLEKKIAEDQRKNKKMRSEIENLFFLPVTYRGS